jgi:hypothetical protein
MQASANRLRGGPCCHHADASLLSRLHCPVAGCPSQGTAFRSATPPCTDSDVTWWWVQRQAATQAEASCKEAAELRERLREQGAQHARQMGAALREAQVMHPSTVSEVAEPLLLR